MISAEKVQLWLSIFLRLSIVVAGVSAGLQRNWLVLFLCVLALVLTFFPTMIERNLKIYLPAELEIAIIVFIYATIFLGNVHSYYTKLWWWDVVLHTASGVILGAIGFILLYVLNNEPKIPLKMTPAFVALFSFTFAVATGTVWEIFEFSMDSWFGLNMQKSGLVDTMFDLIVDSIGGLFAALLGYLYLKSGSKGIVQPLVHKFVEQNPKIFKK